MNHSVLEKLLEPQKHTTMAESVYLSIRQLLLTGKIPPGERVTLRGLAKALGTSSMPVREAITQLVNDGALEVLPNRMVRVFKPKLSEFQEIVKLRCCLEGFAAKEAVPKINEDSIQIIKSHVEKFYQLAHSESIDASAIIMANRVIHFELYASAEMPRLVKLIENLWTQIGSVFALSMDIAKRNVVDWEAFQHHERLVKGLKSGDADEVKAAVIDDILHASIFIQSVAELEEG